MAFAGHILVPTDFSKASELAVEAAAMLAKDLGARVTAVHVYDPDALRPPSTLGFTTEHQERWIGEMERTIEQAFDQLRSGLLQGVREVETRIARDSSPARGICDLARQLDVDLVVIATHGRTGVAHLLIGSVAERVVRHAPCPVLTLRSKSRD
jgi:universal stress protein A